MLTIIKPLNNNIVLAKSADTNDEIILFGKGIGFKKKTGDLIDLSSAEKVFHPKKNEKNIQTSKLLEDISTEVLIVTEKIVSLGEKQLKGKLNHSILLSLADHIQFAIERDKDLIEDNPLQYEVPYLYSTEYKIGKMALEIIREDLGISLPEMEASFIALHFVNAQGDSNSMENTMQSIKLIKNVIYIIEQFYEIELDKTTITYSRFVTHLRYLIARQKINNNNTDDVPMDDDQFSEIIREQYMRSYACALLIKEMIKKEFQWQVTDDEIVYLVIYIERLVEENKKS